MIGAVILAAGMSKRMGVPKQTLPFGDTSLLLYVVNKVLRAKVDSVIIVLGFEGEKIAEMFLNMPVKVVYNKDFSLGLSTSVKKGLRFFIEEAGIANQGERLGVLFVLGDQPGVETSLINKLVDKFEQGGEIVAPFFNGKRGNPVLFSQKYFPLLLQIEGDQGARKILKQFPAEIQSVEVADEKVFLDIDTPRDYLQVSLARLKNLEDNSFLEGKRV